MKDGPNIVGIAALIGDRARADILTALMGGQSLTATELATHAGVTKPTMSAHLSKLVQAHLLAVESQGRHRYFRLADRDVADLIEHLMGVAYRTGAVRVRSSPREPALRKARVCYDHLAGDLGVLAYESLAARQFVHASGTRVDVTTAGQRFFRDFGIEPDALVRGRRPLCRTCLDWSVRRHHLGGALGAALLAACKARRWLVTVADSRRLEVTPQGRTAFVEHFGVDARLFGVDGATSRPRAALSRAA